MNLLLTGRVPALHLPAPGVPARLRQHQDPRGDQVRHGPVMTVS